MAKKKTRNTLRGRTGKSTGSKTVAPRPRLENPAPVQTPAPVPPPAPPVEHTMKSIWFMVGLVLIAMGGVIFLTGLYDVLDPSEIKSAMGHLKPDIWWGAFMVVVGLIFVVSQRKSSAG